MLERLKAWAESRYAVLLSRTQAAADAIALAPQRWAVGSLLAVTLLTVVFNLRAMWRAVQRFRLAAYPERSPQQAASLWYERMVGKLGRRGWRKSESQTPAEFVRTISDDLLRQSVLEFTRHYEGARFGNSAEDARHLPELYEEIAGKKS
jgi:hypothetical protein